ncbi:MAG: GNAT family N-acetyltransferase [Defluviitaleaceae bacterium]|nr:GNAT family N-acetyltransferase [Defluviitaleaceae bacterium]
MLHKITKGEYINNPCGASSLAFWKNKSVVLPDNIKVVHKSDFCKSTLGKTEYYFRLLHELIEITSNDLSSEFNFKLADIENQKGLIADFIINCYNDMNVTEEIVEKWTKTEVFDSDLWVFIYEKSTNLPVAFGIAEYDAEIKEGVLDWIQVLPKKRGFGLGQAIVSELLLRLKNKGAKFVTVSGKIDNETNPEALYRKCGFMGGDIWCVNNI